jgi:hypothetical protein
MVRSYAREQAELRLALKDIVDKAKDGNPKSQARMTARLEAAGALRPLLTPGKRGKYRLMFFGRCGWDPARDALITLDDPIPAKPWVTVTLTKLEGLGRGHFTWGTKAVLFITHHSLSRAAQRSDGLRSAEHLSLVVSTIAAAFENLIDVHGVNGAIDRAPPAGWRVPITDDDKTVVVLSKHRSRHALVAATVI